MVACQGRATGHWESLGTVGVGGCPRNTDWVFGKIRQQTTNIGL